MILIFEVLTVPAIIFGILSGFNSSSKERKKLGKELYFAFLFSGLLGIVVAYLRAYTNKVNKAWYSIYLLSVEIPILILLIVLIFVSIKKKDLIKSKFFLIVSTVYVFILNSYLAPTVFLFVTDFPKGESGVFSTAVLFKMLGFLLGLLFVTLLYLGFYRMSSRHKEKSLKAKFIVILLILLTKHSFALIQPLFVRRIIPFSKGLFNVLTFVVNNNYMFIFMGIFVGTLVPISIWYNSYFMNEPYSNPAEHRKIRAEARRRKRWSFTLLTIFIVSVLSLTVIKAYDEREIQLSPVEESVVEGDYIYIPTENVDDGNLHRFHHMAEGGKVEVRFIIIKKAEHAYGIGLDACEI